MDDNMLCYLSVSCLGTKKTPVANTNVCLSPSRPLPLTGISVGSWQHICSRLAARHQNRARLTHWSRDKIVDILQTTFSKVFSLDENYYGHIKCYCTKSGPVKYERSAVAKGTGLDRIALFSVSCKIIIILSRICLFMVCRYCRVWDHDKLERNGLDFF